MFEDGMESAEGLGTDTDANQETKKSKISII